MITWQIQLNDIVRNRWDRDRIDGSATKWQRGPYSKLLWAISIYCL